MHHDIIMTIIYTAGIISAYFLLRYFGPESWTREKGDWNAIGYSFVLAIFWPTLLLLLLIYYAVIFLKKIRPPKWL